MSPTFRENSARLVELLQIVRRDPRVSTLVASLESGSLRRRLPAEARDALEITDAADAVLSIVAVIGVKLLAGAKEIAPNELWELRRRVWRHHGVGLHRRPVR